MSEMPTTSNYGFRLPRSEDPVSIGDINYNFSEIDENLDTWVGSMLGDIVDNTLTVSGKAADAKVTGDRLAAIVSPSGASANDVMHIDSSGNMVPVAFSNYLSPTGYWQTGKAADASAIYQYVTGYTQRGSGQANRVYVTNSNGNMTTSDTAASIIKMTNYELPRRYSAIVATDSVLAAIAKLEFLATSLADRVAALEAASSTANSSL